MGKFHISEDGNPRPCTAQVCPLGGSEEDHITSDSMNEVREFAERINRARYEIFANHSKNSGSGFGSRADREKALNPALEFHNRLWEHPHAGYMPPRESFLKFYEDQRKKYRMELADGFEVSPKHVYLEENLAVIEKEGKFLVLSPIGMYADIGEGAVGEERTEKEIRDAFEAHEYSLNKESDRSDFRAFLDGLKR